MPLIHGDNGKLTGWTSGKAEPADLDTLNDAELASRARDIHNTLLQLPRSHHNRDEYILAWRLVIDEMNRRSLPAYPPSQNATSETIPGETQ